MTTMSVFLKFNQGTELTNLHLVYYKRIFISFLKKFIAILAFVGILLQTFSQVVIVAEYYANKDYIAKNLCENRDKPQLHCEGKCCLKKKLAKEGKDQAPSPRNQKNQRVIVLFCADNNIAIRSEEHT